MKYSWKKALLSLVFLLTAVWPVIALAHGGGTPQLVREPAGPYLVSVWTLPETLAVGEINFVVLVTSDKEGGVDDYVLDADITVRLTHKRSGETIETKATHDQATNNLFYESYFEIGTAGQWDGEVVVDYGGESGAVTFPIDVTGEGTQTNWALYGGLGVVVLAAGWFMIRSRSSA